MGRVAAERGTLLMLCDQCALERCLAEGEIGAALPAIGLVLWVITAARQGPRPRAAEPAPVPAGADSLTLA